MKHSINLKFTNLHTIQNESDTNEILVPFSQNMLQSIQTQDLGSVSLCKALGNTSRSRTGKKLRQLPVLVYPNLHLQLAAKQGKIPWTPSNFKSNHPSPRRRQG